MDSLSYIGGLFDGEGAVVIVRDVDGKSCSYSLRTVIGMVKPEGVQLVHSHLGGQLSLVETKGSPVWIWTAHSSDAYHFLKTIRPYLLVKTEEAEVGIKFFEEYQGPGRGRRAATQDRSYLLVGERYKELLSSLHSAKKHSSPGRPKKIKI